MAIRLCGNNFRSQAMVCVSVLVLGLCAGQLAASSTLMRLALSTGAVVVACAVALHVPRAALYLLAVWLVIVGTVRRLTTGLVGAAPTADPLLAIAPIAVATIAFLACRGGLRVATRLTTAVVILIALLAASALNPLQGGLTVGLSGAAVVVMPMLAFFVGRALTEQVLARLLRIVAFMSIPAAGYGLFQTFVRFPVWDQRWIDTQGYTALNVGGVIRPFGSFASGQEYGLYCAIGLVIVVSFSQRRNLVWALPLSALLAGAVWYESSRTIVVFLALALAIVGAARAGWPLWRGAVATALVLISVPWVVGQLAADRPRPGQGAVLQDHQVAGLSDPFGKESTLPFHLDLAASGIGSIVRNPLGTGVGAVTGAGKKFGGASAGTEVDIGNAAVAGGILGLGMYLVVAVMGFRRVYAIAARRRDGIALAALGILVVPGLQWLNGGLYSITWLPWLMLGWSDNPRTAVELTPLMAGARVEELEPST